MSHAPEGTPAELLTAYAREIADLAPFETLTLTPHGQVLERRLKVDRHPAAIVRALAGLDLTRYRITAARFADERVLLAIVPLEALDLIAGEQLTLTQQAKGL